jgi:hypothetical protein
MLPAGLKPGDHLQIIFRTSGERDGTSSNIAVYNSFVTEQALPITNALKALGYKDIGWTAIASTKTVDAKTNAPQVATVYDTQGNKVTDLDKTHGLYLTQMNPLLNPPKYDQDGKVGKGAHRLVWTGTNPDGTHNVPSYLGDKFAIIGTSDQTDKTYLFTVAAPTKSTELSFYGLSTELTVPPSTSPEPSTLTLLSLGTLGLLGYYWRWRKHAAA